MKSISSNLSVFTAVLLAGLLLVLAGFASGGIITDAVTEANTQNSWEYKVITITDGYANQRLNEQVSEFTWELVDINEGRAVFRRLISK